MPRLLLAVVLLLSLAAPVRAQFGFFGGSSYDPMAEPATTDEVDRLSHACGFDDAATAGARSLVEACNTTLQRNARRASRMWEKLYLSHPREDFEDTEAYREIFQKESEKQRAAHDECAKTLLSDLRALVPQGRDAAWDAFERRRHRRLYLNMSDRMGIAVDLVAIAEAQKIETLPPVAAVLADYEPSLDKLIVARVPVAIEWADHGAEAQQKNDTSAIERMFSALRDADCSILHLQREAARKLLEAAPAEKQGDLRDLLLTHRSPYIQTKPPVRMRAERLLKSGRLAADAKEALGRAARTFDERSRALDNQYLVTAEDLGCTRTWTETQNSGGDFGTDMKAWYEESRKLQADLLAVLEKYATDDDLDWADRQQEGESGEPPPAP